jgi:hypothetical protein
MWRSKPALDDALAECLSLLERGEATLEGCLARYPELADELRPLLLVALRLREGPVASPSPAVVAQGRRRLMEKLAEEQARRAEGRLRLAWGTVPFGAPLRLALWVTTALAVFVIGAWLMRTWMASPVAGAAELVAVDGAVEVLPAGSDAWVPAALGADIRPGDRIRTGRAAQALLAFFEGSTTTVAPETEVTVQQLSARRNGEGRTVVLYQARGETTHQVEPAGADARFEVVTPVAVAAVHGTRFAVRVQPDEVTYVVVESGVVSVRAQEVSLAAREGQEVIVEPGGPPRLVSHQPTPTATPTTTPVPTPTPPLLTPSPTVLLPTATATLTPTPTPRPPSPTPVPPSPTAIPPSYSTPVPPPPPPPTLPPTPRPPTSTPTPCCGPPTPSP